MVNHIKASYYFPEPYTGTVKIGEKENTMVSSFQKMHAFPNI